jgi:hypothetical protein
VGFAYCVGVWVEGKVPLFRLAFYYILHAYMPLYFYTLVPVLNARPDWAGYSRSLEFTVDIVR